MKTPRSDDVVCGLWKFGSNVESGTLVNLAKTWATDSNYAHLYVRRYSKNQWCIGFQYVLTGGLTHEKFVYKVTDLLKRRFGNKFVAWDVASPTWVVEFEAPIPKGTKVKTTTPNDLSGNHWEEHALKNRRWNVEGTIAAIHEAELGEERYYDVQHEDDSYSFYSHSELEVLSST